MVFLFVMNTSFSRRFYFWYYANRARLAVDEVRST
jgi:hypothetical protein